MFIYYTYIIGNWNHKVLYTGVTNNLERRIYEHKKKLIKGFTQKYNCSKLLWYEEFSDIEEAIMREKQIKSGNRKRKDSLIQEFNPEWGDLAGNWFG